MYFQPHTNSTISNLSYIQSSQFLFLPSREHFFPQYFFSSQQFYQFLRQVNGRPQEAHFFTGRLLGLRKPEFFFAKLSLDFDRRFRLSIYLYSPSVSRTSLIYFALNPAILRAFPHGSVYGKIKSGVNLTSNLGNHDFLSVSIQKQRIIYVAVNSMVAS